MPAWKTGRGALLMLVAVCGVGLAAAASGVRQQPQTGASPSEPTAGQAAVTPLDGATLFHERGCEYCHGAGAVGTAKGPSLLGVGKRLKPAAIQHQIHEGGGGMPAFAEALAPAEIDELVKYLATLKKASSKKHGSPKSAGSQEAGR